MAGSYFSSQIFQDMCTQRVQEGATLEHTRGYDGDKCIGQRLRGRDPPPSTSTDSDSHDIPVRLVFGNRAGTVRRLRLGLPQSSLGTSSVARFRGLGRMGRNMCCGKFLSVISFLLRMKNLLSPVTRPRLIWKKSLNVGTSTLDSEDEHGNLVHLRELRKSLAATCRSVFGSIRLPP